MLGDQLGSTSVIVSQAGAAQATNYYFPFGGNRGGAAFSDLTTKHFTGQYHESGLPGGEGLSYYNARWYDPQLGRFVSADTIVPEPSNPQKLNRFSYLQGNPVNHVDPTGHDCDDGPQTWAACRTGRGSSTVIRAADTRTGGGRTYSMVRNVRIYYLNPIGLGKKATIHGSNDRRDEKSYTVGRLKQTFGDSKVTHIPVYHDDGSKVLGYERGSSGGGRVEMLGELLSRCPQEMT